MIFPVHAPLFFRCRDFINAGSFFIQLKRCAGSVILRAAWGLRKKHPELKRSYKAPLIMVGAPASALIYLYMMTELSNEAFYTGVIWCLLGCWLPSLLPHKELQPLPEMLISLPV